MNSHTRKLMEAKNRMPSHLARALIIERLIIQHGRTAVMRHRTLIRKALGCYQPLEA